MTMVAAPAYREVLPPEMTGPDHPEWFAARRAGITASEIGVICGLVPSDWSSPFKLYWQKVGELGEDPGTERMHWGRRLEAPIAEHFAERHPEFLVCRAGLYAHPDRPWQLATPDRLILEGRDEDQSAVAAVSALEVKSDDSLEEWGPDGSDEIPVKYRAQVLWQADVLGLPGGHVAALLPGKRYREYFVKHDEADLHLMRAAAEAFMDLVRRREPPPLDGSHATISTLKALHPELDDAEVVVPKHVSQAWLNACHAAKKAERRKREVEAILRGRMGRARYAVTSDGDRVATRVVYDRKPYQVGPSTIDSLRPPKETP